MKIKHTHARRIAASNTISSAVKQALTPLLYASAAALTALPIMTQAAEEKLEEVVVTGSRVRVNGMETGTPTTVVTLEQLEVMNPSSLIDALADLPMFNGSATVEGFVTGAAGFNFFASPGNGSLNLRGLAGRRTLTLLDGRRVVSSTLFGGPSLTLFPQQLMKSVESVTGGASAAYGTDAVTGVVNYLLNTKFEGLRANVRYGILENGRGPTAGEGISGGFKLGSKTHILLSAENSSQTPVRGREGFDWYTNTRYMANPDPNAGSSPQNPLNIPRPNVVSRVTSLDGTISFPQKTSLGSYIMSPDGTASPFVLGTYFDNTQNSKDGGGSGTINDEETREFRGDNHNRNYFAYIDHDVNDQLNVYVQAMQGKTFSSTLANQSFSGSESTAATGAGFINLSCGAGCTGAPIIYSGNPYIPANIQALMTANNINYLKLSRASAPNDFGNTLVLNDTKTTSITTGFNYRITTNGRFNDWMIKGYYQGGHTDTAARQFGYIRNDRFFLALDAIKDPATGNIICNVSRFPNAPENASVKGCQPLNLFGRGNASPQAVEWVTGYDAGRRVAVNGYFLDQNGKQDPIYYEYVSGRDKARIIDIHQDVYEISADGNLFQGFGAGPVAAAIGYNFREDSFVQVVNAAGDNPAIDPAIRPNGANNAAIGRRGLPTPGNQTNYVDMVGSNVPFAKGNIKVTEAFTELSIPLLANKRFIKEFTLGAAARWADYEGPGETWSWKGQFSWRINEELRLRGTVSHDMRAGNLAERFDRTGAALGNIADTVEDPNCKATGPLSTTCRYGPQYASYGNYYLKPELAETQTAGFVYQPQKLQGFQVSMDWYRTFVRDSIGQLMGFGTVQQVLDDCVDRKDAFACSLFIREGDTSTQPTAPAGLKRISLVLNPYVNQQWAKVMGVDSEVSYNTDINIFGGGERLGARLLLSYMDTNATKSPSGTVTENAGPLYAPWQSNLSFNYSRGSLSASLQTSYEWGRVPGAFDLQLMGTGANAGKYNYEDVTLHYQIIWNGGINYNYRLNGGSSIRFGLNVQNLFDKDPRPAYNLADGARGDLLGRRYSFSMNYSF